VGQWFVLSNKSTAACSTILQAAIVDSHETCLFADVAEEKQNLAYPVSLLSKV
jgi:hypothetical protein